MDYETSDGSQFSLREVWAHDGTPEFEATLITAFVDGYAYAGRATQRIEEMDDVAVIQYLEPVPEENIFPPFPPAFTRAPPFDMSEHYLKAPQFTYEDRQPGQTLVADRLLAEATVLERLKKSPHPNLVAYYGCVLKGNRITHLSLKRCYCSLSEYYNVGPSDAEKIKLLEQIQEGLQHLHSLGLAHNDINPDNVCVDAAGHAMIVDFDSCAPFGEPLVKGVAPAEDGKPPISSPHNDIRGFQRIRRFLFNETASDEDDRSSDESENENS